MNGGGDALTAGRRSFQLRLGLSRIGCCGATWGLRRTPTMDVEENQTPRRQQQLPNLSQLLIMGQAGVSEPDPHCIGPVRTSSGMNLAAALAAERDFFATEEEEFTGGERLSTAPGTPRRVSLMRLLKETEMEGRDAADEKTRKNERAAESDTVCCVCMGRKKGAAFIPCGHTFCRVCSREMWLHRGSCPLCNRTILHILDIF